MKFLWQPQALNDLENVHRYIATDNPTAADRIVVTIATAVHDLLSAFPESGRIGRVEGTRELVVANSPFIVPYRINDNLIEILGVHHASRCWPESF